VHRVIGIVNGTTNYILSQMAANGTSYHDALADAQSLGYAERDPTADVEGFDAGAKAAIIASIAFGVRFVAGDVYHEGISNVTETDIAFATRLGYTIKLLAICERFDDGSVAVRVHPAMVLSSHPLASVRDSFNAVFVEGDAVGDLMFYGRGAGGRPTASAVLGDVIDAALNRAKGTAASIGALGRCRVRPIDELSSPFYLNVEVSDQPGVLAAVAGVFGEHGVSIRSMEQEGLGGDARIIFITHIARESDVRATLRELAGLDVVREIGSVLRVIDDER
jgi:homoserine dehydrogenase